MVIKIFSKFTDFINNMGIFKKLISSYLLLSLIPIICVGAISYNLTYKTLNNQVKQSINTNRERIVTAIDDRINKIDNYINDVIYGNEFLQMAKGISSGLYSFQVSDKCCQKLVANGDFFLKIHSAQYKPNIYYKNKETGYWRLIEDNDFKLTASLQDGVLYFKKTVVDLYNNIVLGELTVGILLDVFLDEYLKINEKEYGLIIFDSEQKEIYTCWNIYSDTGKPSFGQIKKISSKICTINGTDYFFGKTAITKVDWQFFCFIPKNLIMFEVNKILLTTVYVILICLVTVIFVSFFLSITMTRRLHIIIDRVKNFSAADMNFRKMNNLGGDEIGKLSAVFDLMEQKNRILIKEIYESKIEQKDAELKALQAQINPHFLYNCLDNINIRSILLGDTQISNVVTMLADFYRTSLNKGRNTTLLADEVKNVTAYISLLIELGAKFKVEYDIDENALNYTMISLTLQPIVENAFKHGVFNIGDNGFIRVTIKPQDDKIIISVFDNGKSITEEQAEIALNGKNKGYGLKNVNTRIKLFFGDSYGVQIFGVKGGTECVVTIPAIQYKIDDTNE